MLSLPSVMDWIGALIAVFVMGLLGVRIIRRRRRHRPPAPPPEPAFDLAELQSLISSGKITVQEYEKLRTIIELQQSRIPHDPNAGHGFEVLLK